ncbi:hypothetical protein [Catenovulum sediminis]|uniref:hypothetical protein n=1 Tax=Catenovulum sediminis TaxID=1740262 RepID=UPI001FE5ED68|nr:hypothetical protein [Catenovulum sediminis]
MDLQNSSVIFLGLVVGLLHAFDADHVMAMSTYVNKTSRIKLVLLYATRWGIGHGGVLSFLACILLLIGFQLPQWLVHAFEMAVGVLLIYLGVRLLAAYNRAWFDKLSKRFFKHDHMPLFIGMLHGVAGSAPLLALLPNMQQTDFMLHIALFSIGCLVGMFLFGLGLGLIQTRILQPHTRLSSLFTQLMGCSSIGLGGYWLIA